MLRQQDVRIGILAAAAICFATNALSETLGYGSRAGMEVTVLRKRGLNTANAVIYTKHTRENAKTYCREYVLRVTEKCIREELATNLRNQANANCHTGVFINFYGEQYRFEGRNLVNPNVPANYIIRDLVTDEIVWGSFYGYNIVIFQALCPSKVPVWTE